MSWYKSGTDICAEFEKGNYEFLQDYADNNADNIIRDWNSNREEFQQLLQMGTLILQQFERNCVLKEEYRAIFSLGELNGMIKSYAQNIYEKEKDDFTWEQSSKVYGRIKHLDDIVTALYNKGSLTQAELAKHIEINTSTLSECMKRIANTNFVVAQKNGKYKVFRLSDYGMRYYKMLKGKRDEFEGNIEIYAKYFKKMRETWSEIANREDQYLTIQRKDKIVPFRIANSLGGRNNSSRLDKNTYRKKERLRMTNGGIWQDEVREN